MTDYEIIIYWRFARDVPQASTDVTKSAPELKRQSQTLGAILISHEPVRTTHRVVTMHLDLFPRHPCLTEG